MKISVIIPSYKPQNYLWECLSSLLSQTLPKEEFEVVLVLNGCAEPWKGEIEKYIATNMQGFNVNFIHTEEGGVSNARNLGLEAARGEYITFIDDDDYVSRSYLKELLTVASKSTISLCYPLSFEDGVSIYKPFYITKDYLFTHINKQCHWYKARRYFNGPVYKLIHRDIIGDRRFDTRFTHGEDSLFMFCISDRFRWVSFTSRDAIYYRRNRVGSAMTTRRSLAEIINNEWRLFRERTKIVFYGCTRYSLRFYLRSILSGLRNVGFYIC